MRASGMQPWLASPFERAAAARGRAASPLLSVCALPRPGVCLPQLRPRSNLLQRRLCEGSQASKATRGWSARPREQPGREAHALRSRRYRVRIKAGVTHQGPPRTDNAARLGSAAADSEPSKPASPRRGAMRPFHLCDWCRSGCSPFVRQQFLRRRRPYRIATRRPVHCRPP